MKTRTTIFTLLCSLIGAGVLAMPAVATLIDRGLFNDGLGGRMNLIYDDDLDLTWLGGC